MLTILCIGACVTESCGIKKTSQGYLGHYVLVDEVQCMFDFTNYGYVGNNPDAGDIEEFEQYST